MKIVKRVGPAALLGLIGVVIVSAPYFLLFLLGLVFQHIWGDIS